MTTVRQQITATAIGNGIGRYGWQHQGEREMSDWFFRKGQGASESEVKQKGVQIEVRQSSLVDVITVVFYFLNSAGAGAPVKGEISAQIQVQQDLDEDEVREQVDTLIQRALQIYDDVQKGEGVASAQALKEAK